MTFSEEMVTGGGNSGERGGDLPCNLLKIKKSPLILEKHVAIMFIYGVNFLFKMLF